MKKNLLQETTVRRFMKLANMDILANHFIGEGGYNFDRDDDEEEGEPEMDMEGEPEMDMEPEPEMDLEAPEPEPEMDMGGAVEPAVKDVLQTITQALNDKFGDEGLEINMDAGEEDAAGLEDLEATMPMGDEMDDPELEEMPPAEEEEEEEEEEELALEGVEVIDDNALIEAVLKRVAQRLRSPKSSQRLKK